MVVELGTKLAPSILSANMAHLSDQILEINHAGADYIHIDIMDGHFVPTLTFGPLIVEAIRPLTTLPLDVHLMVENPTNLIPEFARAGADILTVHAEASINLSSTIQQIKDHGARAGVALKPLTPLTAVEECITELDLLLVMTVNPGYPAQTFIESTLSKIQQARHMIDTRELMTELEVDGGINTKTASRSVRAGARVLVAGSAIFNKIGTISECVTTLHRSLESE